MESSIQDLWKINSGFEEIQKNCSENPSKVRSVFLAVEPWWSITFRVRNLSSASYLNIAPGRSALKLQKRVL